VTGALFAAKRIASGKRRRSWPKLEEQRSSPRLVAQACCDGRTIVLEPRWAEGDYGRLPALAAELVRLKVDVIVSVATPASLAAKAATNSIPIVIVAVGEPVETGLIASLARPGLQLLSHLTWLNGDTDRKI
jgi:ABC transporter substrate binding protein